MKKIGVLPVLVLLLARGSDQAKNASLDRHSLEWSAFTSPISIVYYGAPLDQKSLLEMQNWLADLDQRLSRQNALSEINDLNKKAVLTPHSMSPVYEAVLVRALKLSAISGGLFDPSLGPVIEAWGVGSDNYRVPSFDELEKMRPLVDYKNIAYDTDNHTISLLKPGMKLDFGGVAKGYAADWVALYLRQKGISSAMINMGRSSIRFLGSKPDAQDWVVGLQDPVAVLEERVDGEETLLGKMNLSNQIVSTSGVYERYFKEKGVLYHHIIDPKTLSPSKSGILQATVVSDEATDFPDGFSTACLVGGLTKAFELASEFKNLGLILVTSDKVVHVNKAASAYFELLNKDFTLVIDN